MAAGRDVDVNDPRGKFERLMDALMQAEEVRKTLLELIKDSFAPEGLAEKLSELDAERDRIAEEEAAKQAKEERLAAEAEAANADEEDLDDEEDSEDEVQPREPVSATRG